MSEVQEQAVEEASKKVFLRSQNLWKAGEKVPISYAPKVEGMVVTTKWVESVLMVVYLAPPFQRTEGTWVDAALSYKPASSLARKPLAVYDFPFPSDPRIVEEVRKANGNADMLQELVKFLNKQRHQLQNTSEQRKPQSWERGDLEGGLQEQEPADRLSLQLLLSHHDETEQISQAQLPESLVDQLAEKISQRLSFQQTAPVISKSNKRGRLKKEKRKSSSSSSNRSSSSSGTSSDSSSSESDKVGQSDEEDGKGWFSCPFSVEDIRRTGDPRKKMKGKVEERRYLRRALHDIYSEYNTLKAFVESIKAESLSSSSKPYTTDLVWLSHHANCLDLLLLYAAEGPWKTWNELAVDHLARAFLELLVRSSANRSYPEILDERVRKWMKRKRVGVSMRFGPIPAYLAEAKVTDSGIQPKGGWEARNSNKTSSSTSSSFRQKPPNGGTDKKN